MKFLVIGMDGAHVGSFQRGWTPFMAKLMENGDVLSLKEDLISRGWSNIIFGEDAEKTGALYDKPIMNSNYEWSLKYKVADVDYHETNCRPVWEDLQLKGYKVGLMNIPTVFPAPKVNGFCVSGGGGGGPVLQDPIAELCWPRDILNYLLEIGYIVDERPNSLFVEKRFENVKQVFDRFIEMNTKRTEAFISLSKSKSVDFGFLVYRSTFLSEMLILAEISAAEQSNNEADEELISAARTYYSHLDSMLQNLCEAFPDAKVVFTSDHGSVAPKHSFNPNALLRELEFQPRSSKSQSASVMRKVKKFVPMSLRKKIKSNKSIAKSWARLSVAPPNGSLAFSAILGSWRHGIFINDSERFGGPIDRNKIDEYTTQVIDAINMHQTARKHGVVARLPNLGRKERSKFFPDIILSMDDTVVSTNISTEVFSKFDYPIGPLGIKSVTDGQLLVVKSEKALCVAHRFKFSETSRQKSNLTVVHDAVIENL